MGVEQGYEDTFRGSEGNPCIPHHRPWLEGKIAVGDRRDTVRCHSPLRRTEVLEIGGTTTKIAR
eukprot:3472526-Heterocapsa_arctica.AAC.1